MASDYVIDAEVLSVRETPVPTKAAQAAVRDVAYRFQKCVEHVLAAYHWADELNLAREWNDLGSTLDHLLSEGREGRMSARVTRKSTGDTIHVRRIAHNPERYMQNGIPRSDGKLDSLAHEITLTRHYQRCREKSGENSRATRIPFTDIEALEISRLPVTDDAVFEYDGRIHDAYRVLNQNLPGLLAAGYRAAFGQNKKEQSKAYSKRELVLV